jgi:hypothetical protein
MSDADLSLYLLDDDTYVVATSMAAAVLAWIRANDGGEPKVVACVSDSVIVAGEESP